jgi:hypothetical protein
MSPGRLTQWREFSGLAIDLPPVPDVDHDHQEYLIVDLIEDPVVPAPAGRQYRFLQA